MELEERLEQWVVRRPKFIPILYGVRGTGARHDSIATDGQVTGF